MMELEKLQAERDELRRKLDMAMEQLKIHGCCHCKHREKRSCRERECHEISAWEWNKEPDKHAQD